jgi:hypothetical protein
MRNQCDNRLNFHSFNLHVRNICQLHYEEYYATVIIVINVIYYLLFINKVLQPISSYQRNAK